MDDPTKLQKCNACGAEVLTLRNFGPQALTNCFPPNGDETVRVHPLVLGACSNCAMVQLGRPCPAELLRPMRPMHYNEPESHLDALVDEIAALPGVSRDSRFCGMTYKEATTLERLRKLGYHHLRQLSGRDDFQIEQASAGLETIQARMTPEVADRLVKRHGTFDVLLVRHILEHAHNLTSFLTAMKRLTAPGGYVIIEVPDCTTMFEVLDYSFLWEEHVSYFTPSTLTSTLQRHALNPLRVFTYPYALENSLIAITAPGRLPPPASHEDLDASSAERRRGERYAASFPRIRALWTQKLTAFKRRGPVAVLGAGHLAVTFINLFGLEPLIDYVCDDAAEKVNRFVPGTQLRIASSEVLSQTPLSICLMAVAPESEAKVLARHQEFINRGGQFASIFAASEQALKLEAASDPESDEL